MKFLDINNWKRKQQYHLFKEYNDPYFNITANVDVTALFAQTKKHGDSFFLASLFLSLKAANEIEEFRYRMRGDKVIIHDQIHAGSTILQDDETFGFCYFYFQEHFNAFHEQGKQNIAKQNENKVLLPQIEDDNLIHYSVIPWISFTQFKHANNYQKYHSIPRLTFGKFFDQNGRKLMPVSVEVNHALMDGLHVGRFFEKFQSLLNNYELRFFDKFCG
jgi:chloramphenicol O-acetyltransferase type A